jgi:hypothetical protein
MSRRAVVALLMGFASIATAVIAVSPSVVPARGAPVAGPAQESPPAAVPLDGDFDGDGRMDIFWYGPGGNPDHHWFGRSNQQFGGRAVTISGTYQPLIGDYDGDGRDDIFWYRPGPAGDVIYYGTANRSFTAKAINIVNTYQPLIGDYDGDGRDDIFWYRPGPAGDVVYYGTASRSFAGKAININGTYQPLIGDYDGDRRSDIFWYGPGTVGDVIYYGTSSRSFAGKVVTVRGTYQAMTGDFDGGGRTDVFWWAPDTTDDIVWFATTGRSFVSRPTTIDLAYERPQPLQPQSLVDAYVPFGYIAHAAGGYEGRTYTNSFEAFQFNYDRGFRVFELDFVVLGDGTVLAAHTGLEPYYGLDKPFTEATWADLQGQKFDGKYTIMRSQDVVQLLRDHPDAYVILDTKYQHNDIFRRFVAQTGGAHALMDRVLPHIMNQAELDQYRNSWQLRNYVIALYRTQFANAFDDPEVIQFVRNNRSPAVMMWWRDRNPSLTLSQNHFESRRFTPAFAAQIQSTSAVAAVHSIRDPSVVPGFEALHVGVYSDGPFAVGTQRQAPEAPPVDPVFPDDVVPA